MIKKTEAIVLKNVSFAEADLIVTYLTKEYGVLKLFAKSPKKIKSRFGSSLEPLTYSNIAFFGKENTPLPRLIQSDIIKNFQSLREDFLSFMKINDMLELCITFLPEKEPNSEIFTLLLTTLSRLEEKHNFDLYNLIYKIKFLEISGLLPNIDVCGKCGNRVKGDCNGRSFSVQDSSIICNSCLNNLQEQVLILSNGSLNFFRSLLKWDCNLIKRVKAPENLVRELADLINSHIAHIFGLKLVPYKTPTDPKSHLATYCLT